MCWRSGCEGRGGVGRDGSRTPPRRRRRHTMPQRAPRPPRTPRPRNRQTATADAETQGRPDMAGRPPNPCALSSSAPEHPPACPTLRMPVRRSAAPATRTTSACAPARTSSGAASAFSSTACTDFRTQALANGVEDVDFVLMTHTHADHVNGIDDLRAYNMVHRHPISIHGEAASLEDIRQRFAYCFRPRRPAAGSPTSTCAGSSPACCRSRACPSPRSACFTAECQSSDSASARSRI